MAEVEDKPTLTFNDTNYVIEDLSEEQKYLVGQIQNLQAQESEHKVKLDQVMTAIDGFKTRLQSALENALAEGEIVE